jgi:hypothetical protein
VTDPTTPPLRADDALKYVVAYFAQQADWIVDSVGGAGCRSEDGDARIDHTNEMDCLEHMVKKFRAMAARYGPPGAYSDGRRVVSHAEIGPYMVTEHVWHPIAAAEEPEQWSSPMPHDPHEPSAGIYSVTTDPATQTFHTCIVKPFSGLDE